MTRIWIVRHGNTFEPGEEPRRIGARTDIPLVESGREQARALRDYFEREGITFDRVLSSPLRRTWETAQILGASKRVEYMDWLTEIDHGPDEDQPEILVMARIGADAIAAWDRESILPLGWSIGKQDRVAAWRALLMSAGSGEQVAVVTSNGAARFALSADPGIASDATVLPSRKLRTGAFGRLARTSTDLWQIDSWDCRP